MDDPVGPLGEAQDQVVVLAPVILGAEAADGLDQRSPVDAEMAHIVRGEQQIGGPIGLEERVPALLPRVIDLVLVGVDQVGRRGVVERADHLEECRRRQDIIMVEEPDELPRGQRQGGIGGPGNPLVPRTDGRP